MEQADKILPDTSGTIDLNGMQMYYEEFGEGRPLILLHGGTSTCQTWQEFLPLFIPHFRVITPDSRAHGRSNNPSGMLSYRQMADDFAVLIDKMHLSEPLVFGYSDGGQIVLELGMRYPGLCRALVVGAAWYKFSPLYLDALKSAGLISPSQVDFELIQGQSPEWVEEMRTVHTSSPDPQYWRTLLQQISTMWWTPLDYAVEDFRLITDPTLIMQGDRDSMIALGQSFEMYQFIPDAELFIIPGADHSTAKHDLSMRIVLDFLLRHAGSRVNLS
jgi:pimeloyl-ACP methyl ester carboxylesterase